MKIIHIEDFFNPDAGYQINLISKFMAKSGHKVTIVTSEMDKVPKFLANFFAFEDIKKADENYIKTTGIDIIRLPIKTFISGRAVFKKEIFNIVDRLSPDILYVHGNDTLIGISYTLKIKKLKYPLIMDSHMLEMASKNKLNKLFRLIYKCFFAPQIKKYRIPIIRTQNDDYIQRCLGISLSYSPWISVGSDTMLFKPNAMVKKNFRKNYSIPDDEFVVIYAGKLDESKGGKFLAETILEKFENEKVTFIIVGNISSDNYGKETEKLFASSKNKIIRFPSQKYIDLAQFYQASDLSVFPKQCSLSFYDVQACGLPVIFEDNNINTDRLSCKNGFTFESGSIADFRKKIMDCLNMSKDEFNKMSRNSYQNVKENYDYEEITKQYIGVISQTISDFKNAKV